MTPNTPEKKCCPECLKCPDYPNAGHNYCHNKDCHCHTTEPPQPLDWERKFFENYGANKIWVTPSRENVETILGIHAFIQETLAHHHTQTIEAYWKHLESCTTGVSEDGKVLYIRVDKDHFDQAITALKNKI